MSIFAPTTAPVTTTAEGAAPYVAILAEARAAVEAALAVSPMSPEETAVVLEGATAGELDDVTLYLLAHVLAV